MANVKEALVLKEQMNSQTAVNCVTSLTWLCSSFMLTTRSSMELQYDVG